MGRAHLRGLRLHDDWLWQHGRRRDWPKIDAVYEMADHDQCGDLDLDEVAWLLDSSQAHGRAQRRGDDPPPPCDAA